jgi:hypothetical protein
MWLFWLIIVLSISFSISIRLFNSPKAKGTRLENKIHQLLENLALKNEGFALKDLMLPMGDSTTQIDNVLITPKAMFVIEAKNYKGRVFGSINQDQWTLTSKTTKTYKNKRGKSYQKSFINKYQFYNPIKQNETHVNALKKYTKAGFPIYNLVVFGKNTDLNEISDGLNQKVINIRRLNKSIHKLSDLLDNSTESSELVSIKDKIIRDNISDKKLRKKHVKSIKKMYQK